VIRATLRPTSVIEVSVDNAKSYPQPPRSAEVLDMLFKDYEGPEDWPQIEERLGFSSQAPDVSWLSKP